MLGQYATTHRVTLVYTTTVRETSENQGRHNKLTMEEAGITVITSESLKKTNVSARSQNN